MSYAFGEAYEEEKISNENILDRYQRNSNIKHGGLDICYCF